MWRTIGVLIALAAGIWVYTDARKRGYAAGGAALWGLGTFVLLIVFLPLYLIFRTRRRAESRPAENDAPEGRLDASRGGRETPHLAEKSEARVQATMPSSRREEAGQGNNPGAGSIAGQTEHGLSAGIQAGGGTLHTDANTVSPAAPAVQIPGEGESGSGLVSQGNLDRGES